MSWEIIWKVIFIFILVVFALMSVATTILGARDVKQLLQDLNKESDEEEGE